jgi:hypothetical protein
MSWRARLAAVLVAAALAMPVSAAEPKGTGEGIKVHGHWTLEIQNPDGTLAARHEFENALIPTMGSPLLAGLLGNFYEDTTWGIYLWGSPGPCGPVPTNDPCAIGQPPLVVTLPLSSGSPTGTLELSASVTMARDSMLFNVNTVWSARIHGTNNRAFNQFSERAINIQVHQGQIVQVKVVFSFS